MVCSSLILLSIIYKPKYRYLFCLQISIINSIFSSKGPRMSHLCSCFGQVISKLTKLHKHFILWHFIWLVRGWCSFKLYELLVYDALKLEWWNKATLLYSRCHCAHLLVLTKVITSKIVFFLSWQMIASWVFSKKLQLCSTTKIFFTLWFNIAHYWAKQPHITSILDPVPNGQCPISLVL